MSTTFRSVSRRDIVQTGPVPKLWNDTIEAHRRDVRDAILDATAALVFEHGLAPVTMSRIAKAAGIGRATLYKYFQGIEPILIAWHERQVAHHLQFLTMISRKGGTPGERLRAVLEEWAFISHRHHRSELTALLHRGRHVEAATRQLTKLLRDLLKEAVRSGDVREDISSAELAPFCLHALDTASHLPSEAAVRRLIALVLDALKHS